MQLLLRKHDVQQVLLLLVVVLLLLIDSTFCFQKQYGTIRKSTTTITKKTPIVVVVNLSMPPQFPNEDENENKLLSFSMPEIDTEALLKKVGVVAATILAFVLIQKVGLYVSLNVLPELTAEEVREFRL